jgi:DNA-binding response OmpR family regulator
MKRVLIVDDDESIRALLRMTLPAEAYEVTEASDGSEVMELLDDAAPDLVVLDWKMPGRHGAFVLDDLKERSPKLPVIVLTAEGRDTQRALAEALRADAFLTKPFSPMQLLDTIEGLLRREA